MEEAAMEEIMGGHGETEAAEVKAAAEEVCPRPPSVGSPPPPSPVSKPHHARGDALAPSNTPPVMTGLRAGTLPRKPTCVRGEAPWARIPQLQRWTLRRQECGGRRRGLSLISILTAATDTSLPLPIRSRIMTPTATRVVRVRREDGQRQPHPRARHDGRGGEGRAGPSPGHRALSDKGDATSERDS